MEERDEDRYDRSLRREEEEKENEGTFNIVSRLFLGKRFKHVHGFILAN